MPEIRRFITAEQHNEFWKRANEQSAITGKPVVQLYFGYVQDEAEKIHAEELNVNPSSNSKDVRLSAVHRRSTA